LTIDTYLNSTLYIEQNGVVLNISDTSIWQSVYLVDYKTPNNNEFFITPKKQLLDIDLYNKTQLNYLNSDKVNLLTGKLNNLLITDDVINIKTSDLI
jgi:hypothetical protein